MKVLYVFLWIWTCCSGAMAKTFIILDYGAEADGQTLNTLAIQKAIDACTPGDTVCVPSGRYVTGTLILKSNITLFIERDGFLIGSKNLGDYRNYTSANGKRQYYGMLLATGAGNINLTGKGTIDGSSSVFLDTTRTQGTDTLFTRYTRQKKNYRDPPDATAPFVAFNRPQHMLLFASCSNIHIQNLAILNAPCNAISFIECTNLKLSGLKICSNQRIPDAAGIGMSNCKRITISACDVKAGNNAITLNGFNEQDAINNTGVTVTDDVTIANCDLQSSSSAINILSLTEGSVSNVVAHHININNSGRGISLMVRGGGSIQNISFADMYIETRLRTGSWIGSGEPMHLSALPGADTVSTGCISNVKFNNVECIAPNQILLYGSAGSIIQAVQLNDIVFHLKNSSLNLMAGGNTVIRNNAADSSKTLFTGNIPAIYARYVSNLAINNIQISWDKDINQPYFTNGIEVANFNNIKITSYLVKPAPGSAGTHAIWLTDGRLATVEQGDVYRLRVAEPEASKPVQRPAHRKAPTARAVGGSHNR